MNIGTKSVLFGVHQFLLHPLMLAIGWWKAYGFRSIYIGTEPGYPQHRLRWRLGYRGGPEFASLFSPALWVAFLVHDIGYLGKPNMDGPEGETHPELGAAIMRVLFGKPWGDLVLLHSRYYSKKLSRSVSPLCFADKWVIVLEPAWLYLPRVWLSGELREFMTNAQNRVRGSSHGLTDSEAADLASGKARRWHRGMCSYMRRWIVEHQDGRPDAWTRVRHAEGTRMTGTDGVSHPPHYGGADNPHEAIKVIDAWDLGFCLGNTVKYIARAGRKDGESDLKDLKKARWYLDHEIARRERTQK